MKQIDVAELLKKSSQEQAIFFTNQGKIVVENSSPLLPLVSTLERLKISVRTAYQNEDVLMVHLDEEPKSFHANISVVPPRDYFLSLSDQTKIEEMILKASHWMVADKILQCCSCCGAPLEKVLETTEKKCLQCQLSFFPKLSPAVLVLIQRGKEILLGRGSQHPPEMYTVLAGFIDLGESAEQTVHREVREEVGLEVTNLKYFGSQSWPFPDSFMIAFTADYLCGDIKIDPNELEEARWFHRDELPLLPPPSTLSRKLIDSFLKN